MGKFLHEKIVGEEKRSQLQPVVFSDEKNQSGAVIGSLKKSQLDTYDELESYKKLRNKRVRIACIRMLVWLLVILAIPVFVFFSLVIINQKAGHNFFGYTFYIVETESMEDVFAPGDCIVTKAVFSRDDIKIGTDITFIRASDGETVTHRVIGMIPNEAGELEYITKGTNNTNADTEPVAFENVLGRRIKTLSWLGQTVTFFRTPYGIVIFLGVFVLMVTGLYFSFRISNDIRAVGVK